MGDFGTRIGQGFTGAIELAAGYRTGNTSTALRGAENLGSAVGGPKVGEQLSRVREGVDQFSNAARVAGSFFPSSGGHPLHAQPT